tara:strand:- start:8 stop:286 length:279 start_codon:yes stop_codon:yes gene_type:complete
VKKEKENLNAAFKEAAIKARSTDKRLAPDIMLLLYAYYKKATQENHIVPFENLEENDLKGAFKYNAMIQLRGVSPEKAKEEYIDLVNKYILT